MKLLCTTLSLGHTPASAIKHLLRLKLRASRVACLLSPKLLPCKCMRIPGRLPSNGDLVGPVKVIFPRQRSSQLSTHRVELVVFVDHYGQPLSFS